MAFVNDPTNPANMTPQERLAEVAALLAEGVRRFRGFRGFRGFPPSGFLWNLGLMALMSAPEQALMDTVVNACREAENRSYTMVQNVKIEVAALRRMSPAQLRDKYLEVFGEATRTGNKDFLCKRLAWRIQSLAEGSLSDRAQRIRGRAAELARDADIRTTMPRTPPTTPGATPRVTAAPDAGGAGRAACPCPGQSSPASTGGD